MPGHVKLTQSREGEAAKCGGLAFACPLPAGTTPASKPTAHANKSRPTVGPHPRHAAGSIGVKFCAAPTMLLAPREVCASAVSAADPANSNAIARVSVTLRISFLLEFCRDVPHLAVPRAPILPTLLFWSTAE